MADLIYTYEDPPRERDLEKTHKVLLDNGVVAYPTDLNWAFGCDSASSKALERMRKLKPMHPKEQPFSLICASISMAAKFAQIDNHAYRFLKRALPGPFTVLLRPSKEVKKVVKDNRKSLGLRIPDRPMLLALVERLGRPLATTSVPALNQEEAVKFGYQINEIYGYAIDIILDLGQEVPGYESTIVDLTEVEPRLVRKGIGDPGIFDLQDAMDLRDPG